MVKWLTGLVLVLAILWGGWWFVGTRALQAGLDVAIDDARSAGWQIAYDDLNVSGFPSRFDTFVTAPRITGPGGNVAFAAPFLQAFALSYRPNHVIAVAPDTMTFEIPGEVIEVTSGDLRGSFVGTASTDPVLDRSTIAGEAIRVALADLSVGIEAAQWATRQAGGPAQHDVALSLTGVDLSESLRAMIDPGGRLTDRIAGVSLDGQLLLTDAIGPGRAPRPAGLRLRRAGIIWDDIRADLSGSLNVGADGFPEGVLTLRGAGWRSVLDVAVGAGLLPPERAALLDGGLAAMADPGGRIEIDLTFAEGLIRLGPFPIGPAPRL